MIAAPGGFLSGDSYRDNDWLTDRFFDLAARKTLLEEGAFPLRSHLIGGGYPTLGQPFDGSWAPTLLPVLALGPVGGVKLNLLLLLALGTWGVWRLGRDWLGLSDEATAFAAAAFAVSGWLPSMMLVGFYPQALYMAAPGALALLLAPRSPEERIGAGFLLLLLLQQGGNAFVATVGFLFVALWGHAAHTRAAPWRAQLLPWLPLLTITAGLALHHRYDAWGGVLLSLVGAAGLFAPALRPFLTSLRPALLAWGGALLIVGTLGIGKLVALAPLLADASYAHADNLPPSAWPAPAPGRGLGASLDPERHDEHFYSSAQDLLVGLAQRAPAQGDYVSPPDPPQGRELLEPIDRRSATREYEYLGLTPGVLVFVLLGLAVAARTRETRPSVLFLGATAVCMGPHLLPDLHFLLAGGLPRFHSLSQPVKYYNFFILLPAVLLAGMGAGAVLDQSRARGMGRAGAAVLLASLLWPLLQNAPIWADRFAEPMPPWSCDDCVAVKQIGHESWAEESPETIERWSLRHRLRERRRPPAAREYDNALHGVATIDWYGTLELPEPTHPSHYVTSSGAVLPAAGYRGEAWVDGPGEIEHVTTGSSRISLQVSLPGPGRVVINQAYLPGFISDVGTVQRSDSGLLALTLPQGRHDVVLRYRPWPQILGLVASLLAALGWAAVIVKAWRRRTHGGHS